MKRAAGFTLIELVVVMAIAVILAAIAIPAWRHMTSANRAAGAVNALASTLSYARSEAIARGEQVTVCPSANATAPAGTPSCAKKGWRAGWLVFVDKDGEGIYDESTDGKPLRVHGPVSESEKMTMADSSPNGYIAFNRMGFAQPTFAGSTQTALTVVACPPDKRGAHARAVILYLSGAVKTAARDLGTGKTFSCP